MRCNYECECPGFLETVSEPRHLFYLFCFSSAGIVLKRVTQMARLWSLVILTSQKYSSSPWAVEQVEQVEQVELSMANSDFGFSAARAAASPGTRSLIEAESQARSAMGCDGSRSVCVWCISLWNHVIIYCRMTRMNIMIQVMMDDDGKKLIRVGFQWFHNRKQKATS